MDSYDRPSEQERLIQKQLDSVHVVAALVEMQAVVGCKARDSESYQKDWSSAVDRLAVDFERSAAGPGELLVEERSFAVGSDTSVAGSGRFAADLARGLILEG